MQAGTHNARLHDGPRKHRFDRIRKTNQAIDTVDDDIGAPPALQLRDHLEPELGNFGLHHPLPRHLIDAIQIDPNGIL